MKKFFDKVFDEFFDEVVDEFFDEVFDEIFDEFFDNFFWKIFMTSNLLTIASFRIGVPSILFDFWTKIFTGLPTIADEGEEGVKNLADVINGWSF